MKTHVKFTRPVTVDGRQYGDGDVVPAADVPAGYFESCLRVGHCDYCDPPADPEPKPQSPAPTPKKK